MVEKHRAYSNINEGHYYSGRKIEKRGSKLPISVLYYGGHSHDIRNQSDKNCFAESTGSFHNGHYTLCSVSYIKSRIMFVRRKKGLKKRLFLSIYLEGHISSWYYGKNINKKRLFKVDFTQKSLRLLSSTSPNVEKPSVQDAVRFVENYYSFKKMSHFGLSKRLYSEDR